MDSLSLAAMLEALLKESRHLQSEEAKYRDQGNKVIADYVSHKRMGFNHAMAIVSNAITASEAENSVRDLSTYVTEVADDPA